MDTLLEMVTKKWYNTKKRRRWGGRGERKIPVNGFGEAFILIKMQSERI